MLERPILLSLVLAVAMPRTAIAGPGAKVEIRELTGDPGGRTTDDVMKVMKVRGNLVRACYQRELNRAPGLRGQLVVTFKVNPEGQTSTARVDSGSSVRHEALESCVLRQFLTTKFRPSSKPASLKIRLLLTSE